jgi:hypothetical protein
MGFFGPSSSHSGHGSHYGGRSGSHYGGHSSSRPGFFRQSSSFGRSSSYYKRRPRDGFIQRIMYRIRSMLRNLMYYARRHPMKFFFMVIMPLISSGALVGFARRFGIKLPSSMGGGHGGGHGAGRGGGYYGSDGYGREGGGGGMGGLAGGLGSVAGGLGGISSLMGMAKHFM